MPAPSPSDRAVAERVVGPERLRSGGPPQRESQPSLPQAAWTDVARGASAAPASAPDDAAGAICAQAHWIASTPEAHPEPRVMVWPAEPRSTAA